jgi:two-component system sensor histidine kinase PilS (NtrC family)
MSDASNSGSASPNPVREHGGQSDALHLDACSCSMSARVTIAGVLVVPAGFYLAYAWHGRQWLVHSGCLAYFPGRRPQFACGAGPKPPRSTFDAQWVSTIGVDVVTFLRSNYLRSSGISHRRCLHSVLLSVLGPILLALGAAASVTLSCWQTPGGCRCGQPGGDDGTQFHSPGLGGSGFSSSRC